MRSKTFRLCYFAVLSCLGLVLPAVFHAFGGPAAGSVFLPLHIPVLIAGLLLGAFDGFLAGLMLPLLSALFTGMPPPAVLPFKCAELCLYGFFCGLSYKVLKNDALALISALTVSNLVYISVFSLLFYAFGLNVPTLAVVMSNLLKGIPGLILQIVFIPQICRALRRNNLAGFKRPLIG